MFVNVDLWPFPGLWRWFRNFSSLPAILLGPLSVTVFLIMCRMDHSWRHASHGSRPIISDFMWLSLIVELMYRTFFFGLSYFMGYINRLIIVQIIYYICILFCLIYIIWVDLCFSSKSNEEFQQHNAELQGKLQQKVQKLAYDIVIGLMTSRFCLLVRTLFLLLSFFFNSLFSKGSFFDCLACSLTSLFIQLLLFVGWLA